MTSANRPSQPIKFHRFALSGHCHRVELLLSLLDLPVETIEVNLASGAHKTPGFLALNPFGQLPVIQDGDLTLADSNAILIYLATQYGAEQWLPRSAVEAAQQQRWFSVAAGPLTAGPAAARRGKVFNGPVDMTNAQKQSHALFAVMDAHLRSQNWLVGTTVTLADLANYAYTAHAPEGGVSLADYPHIRAWLARIEALPRFVPMFASPVH
ncbi:MAG: glutathione S-transferase [Rhodocyclales bacterium]|nr:glutathione S-transferase [Rhodocyclales bacterium]